MSIPQHLKFLESHEWIATGHDPAAVGISDHAQSEMGEIVFVELPEIGREVEAGEAFAVVESVKAASDIYAPIAGQIVEANEALGNEPGLINEDPYEKGWLVKIKPAAEPAWDQLLSPEDYEKGLG